MINHLLSPFKLGELKLNNGILAASGTFGLECIPYTNPDSLGGIMTRSMTLHPQPGPPPPRLFETASGLMSAVEVESEGIEVFFERELPRWRNYKVPLIINIAGSHPEEYYQLTRRINKAKGIAAIELNLHYLYTHLQSSFLETLSTLIREVKKLTALPIIAKLFPFFAIELLAKRSEEAGADILSVIHGFPAMALDSRTSRSKLGSQWGLLTGPAIKPLALGSVWQIRQTVSVPIIGMGGIFGATDVQEFLAAGAEAVAIGTATLVNPKAIHQILADLRTS